MVKVIDYVKPKAFIAENVYGLLSIEGAIERIETSIQLSLACSSVSLVIKFLDLSSVKLLNSTVNHPITIKMVLQHRLNES